MKPGTTLTDASRDWPTPKASTSGPDLARAERPENAGADLETFASRQWPTPMARDHKGTVSPEALTRDDGRSRLDTLDRIAENLLWMTPNVPNGGRVMDAETAANKGTTSTGQKRQVDLGSQAPLWKTPHGMGNTDRHGKTGGWGGEFHKQAMTESLWSTPDASMANDGELPETWRARQETLKAKEYNGNGAGVPLSISAVEASRSFPQPPEISPPGATSLPSDQTSSRLLPSPSSTPSVLGAASPEETANLRLLKPKLNPRFVEWLMGWPIGWTGSELAETEWYRFKRRMRSRFSSLVRERLLERRDYET
jgi:hypothetical protein